MKITTGNDPQKLRRKNFNYIRIDDTLIHRHSFIKDIEHVKKWSTGSWYYKESVLVFGSSTR